MSNTNYDVELNITYDNEHRHYIPTYKAAVPNFYSYHGESGWHHDEWDYFISFDEEQETGMGYSWGSYSSHPVPFWNTSGAMDQVPYAQNKNNAISESGIYSKVYFRNNHRDKVTFTPDNCYIQPLYSIKALFEVIWNSTGFAANNNAFFKCSTVQKNTYRQYEWVSATVYYKKSTDENYQSVAGTVSGSWSDVRIDTEIGFEDGYTYDVYITAVADDGSTASTPVAQFTTTDAAAVATCISPAGVFTQGEVTFVWSHATEYGTPQYAYDLQYSINNGSSWVSVESHKVTQNTTRSITLSDAGSYKWRVRTYNSNDVAGEWAEASFVNNVPANPPTNLSVNTKGRPTVSWAAVSQSAYQIQFVQNGSVVYDSGAVYTSQTSHFVNKYFDDNRSYVVRLRIYNALGEVSEWVETGYQQPSVTDVQFTVTSGSNGATIEVTPDDAFVKYYLLRNNKLIAEITGESYTDKYAVGLTNYSVVGVTSEDQSDIQTKGHRVNYDHATVITPGGQQIAVNKRLNEAYSIQTVIDGDITKSNFIGDSKPSHYPSAMRLKSFSIDFFDDQNVGESLLGQVVFYADNFENGGYCMVTHYDKTDNFIKNGQGIYANEVLLTLEVTNYDDSIEYPL